MDIFGGLFNSHDRQMKSIEKRADRILALEEVMQNLSDDQLRMKTVEFKERLAGGASLDSLLEEAFAVAREASHRVLGMKHFKVQVIGGIVLYEGNIAEMKTGEGKTLVAVLPAYLNALSGKGVFVVTVNDYLAQRDREEMGRIHEFLGLSVGLVNRELTPSQKKDAYLCDITYGTNSEFGFDYLRDNMALTKDGIVQRSRNYAIIDEVDSILIDDARTPLIITGQGNRPSKYYVNVDLFAKGLSEDEYEYNRDTRTVNLTDIGMDKAESFFGLSHIAESSNMELLHHIRQSLQANYILKKDQDYVVKNNEILIVDKFTGRLLPGRRFSNGLHQAIEAKEGVEIQNESNTLATITYQNYFRMFNKISGMTGTAYTEKAELREIYGMDVFVIPTNKDVQRIDREDKVFLGKEAKINAVVEEIKARHKIGQPVLVGTIFIDQSEKISRLLKKDGIPHNLLNAKQNKQEAEIISLAGQKGAVTIATNMAGRGTDIKLGEGVAELGGLFVLGTERHDSRRIDNQLRGRSGRQGDPGESQFFISIEDSLFEKLGKEKFERLLEVAKVACVSEKEAIENKALFKEIEGAQTNIEAANYRVRRSTIEFDKILNRQRETIYGERNKILEGEDKSEFIKAIIGDLVKSSVQSHTANSEYPEEWDLKGLNEYIDDVLSFEGRFRLDSLSNDEIEGLTREKLIDMILGKAKEIYSEKESHFETSQLRYIERLTLMRNIDKRWTEYLDLVEQMRQGVSLQYVGQQDPVRVFNREAFDMFEGMMHSIKEDTARAILSLATREMAQKRVSEKIKLKEEERLEKVAELEEIYRVNRRSMPRVPSNLPMISFKADINATEEIEAEYELYFMDGGYEEKIDSCTRKLKVTGSFSVELKKPENMDWIKGWHQVKVFVGGQEATRVDFIVDDPADIEKMKSTREEKKKASMSLKFVSNRLPQIGIKFNVTGCRAEKIPAAIIHENNVKGATRLQLPVNKEQAFLNIKKPEKGWKNGLYSIVLLPGTKEESVHQFVVVDEFKSTEDISFNIKFKMEVEGETADGSDDNKPSIQLLGQLIHIDSHSLISNIPLEVDKSGVIKIGFAHKNENWKAGRYEFRLISKEGLLLRKYLKVM